MDNKVLEILLDMQQDMKNMKQGMENIQKDIKDINTRLDKIEFKMNDGFETLEILSENNSHEMTKIKIQVAKVEKRVKEISMIN